MGTHKEEGGVVGLGLSRELVGRVALTQDILQLDAFQQMGHTGIAALYLGADGRFILVFFLYVHKSDVALPTICNIDSQVYGIGRTRRKVEADNYSVHVFSV